MRIFIIILIMRMVMIMTIMCWLAFNLQNHHCHHLHHCGRNTTQKSWKERCRQKNFVSSNFQNHDWLQYFLFHTLLASLLLVVRSISLILSTGSQVFHRVMIRPRPLPTGATQHLLMNQLSISSTLSSSSSLLWSASHWSFSDAVAWPFRRRRQRQVSATLIYDTCTCCYPPFQIHNTHCLCIYQHLQMK